MSYKDDRIFFCNRHHILVYREFNGNYNLQLKNLKIFNYSRLPIRDKEILYNK